MGVRLSRSVDNSSTTFLRRFVFKARSDQSMLNVPGNRGREESGFLCNKIRSATTLRAHVWQLDEAYLRDETDLVSKPSDVEILDLDAVEFDAARNRVAVRSRTEG